VLRKLALIEAADRAALVEDDRARTRRPLVERQDESHCELNLAQPVSGRLQ
jgi:hypothetical protein